MIRVTLPVSRIGYPVYTAGISRGHPKLRIYTLRKRIKMTGRDHPSFVPPCGTTEDR